MTPSITACVPTLDNSETLCKVLESIKQQTLPVRQLIVIDDGSRVPAVENCKTQGVEFHRNDICRGRGYARAEAIKEANHQLVFFCDATNIVPENFLAEAAPHFEDPKVAAVSGRIANIEKNAGAALRWRGRHLFKEDHIWGEKPLLASSLSTYGTLMRKEAVLSVGNFDPNLVHSEDQELGSRLIKAGFSIVGDPSLVVYSLRNDSVLSVLERYWRWNGGVEENMNFSDYLHAIRASLNPMLIGDVRDRDLKSALISLLCPHYGFLRSISRLILGKNQRL